MDDFLYFKQSSKFRFVPDYPICAWNFFKMQKIKSIKKVKTKKATTKTGIVAALCIIDFASRLFG